MVCLAILFQSRERSVYGKFRYVKLALYSFTSCCRSFFYPVWGALEFLNPERHSEPNGDKLYFVPRLPGAAIEPTN